MKIKKIAFLGYDYTLDIAQRLKADGHEIMHIFTFPCDGMFTFNSQIKDFAKHLKIPISEHKIESQNMNMLIKQGCEVFICAGYPHKIPPIKNKNVYGINLHPALLPRGRGIMPLPYIIMSDNKAAGFTIHKLAANFDSGDILYQQAVGIDNKTDVETLSAKIAVKAPYAVSDVIKDIDNYWNAAKPQDNSKATSYPSPSEEMRSLNWNETAKELCLKGRAFGRFGMIGVIENNMGERQKLAVFNFSAWEENHNHKTGIMLRSSSREIIVTIKNGYICLKEFQVIE